MESDGAVMNRTDDEDEECSGCPDGEPWMFKKKNLEAKMKIRGNPGVKNRSAFLFVAPPCEYGGRDGGPGRYGGPGEHGTTRPAICRVEGKNRERKGEERSVKWEIGNKGYWDKNKNN